MIEDDALFTWPGALVGAALLAALFMLAALMGELVTEGSFRFSRSVVTFGLAAFVGYLAVAALLSRDRRPS